MASDFKIVEFDCKFIMQVRIDDNMTEEQIKDAIAENFDFVMEYGASECDNTDRYSAYMTYKDERNIVVTNKTEL